VLSPSAYGPLFLRRPPLAPFSPLAMIRSAAPEPGSINGLHTTLFPNEVPASPFSDSRSLPAKDKTFPLLRSFSSPFPRDRCLSVSFFDPEARLRCNAFCCSSLLYIRRLAAFSLSP